jgi:membrane protein YdbS with pleckstrin-like domain
MEGESTPAAAEWHQLDPRKIQLDRVAGWITTAVLSFGWLFGATIVALVSDDAPSWLRVALFVLWPVFTIALAVLSHRWPAVEHRHARYRIDDVLIEIQSGVVWRTSIAVPRSRVQHLDVTQGPLQRRFGLGVLSIYTAGTEYSQVSLPGLAYEVAQALRDRLLPRDAQVDGV